MEQQITPEDISEQPLLHDNCEAVIVHPTGQLQIVKECWCKLYHVFGPHIKLEETLTHPIFEDIHCMYLVDGEKYQQPQNMFLSGKLKKRIFGAGIFFRKASDLSLEKAKSILV